VDLEKLKKEYAEQDNRATAYPIYVAVQELKAVGIFEEGYSPVGDDNKIKYEHDCENCPNYCEPEPEYCPKDVRMGYMWFDIELFLTIKGAQKYIEADAHNHGKMRTYVKCFNRRNYEMRELLKEIGLKTR